MLKLQGKENKIVLIQAYFPSLSYPEDEVEKLYSQIQLLLDKIPSRDFVFIMGDFNARVGGLHTTYPNHVGKHNIGSSNERGERLASFCSANNLYITNTFFKKRRIHTWNHPNGKSKSQIDFIISRSKFCPNITDVSVLNTPSVSDHRLVRIEVKSTYIWQKPKSLSKKFNVSSLKNIETATSF